MDFEDTTRMDRINMENAENWSEHARDMPYFTVPEGFQLKIIAPTGGALTRFNLLKGEVFFSIYYDINDALGLVGEPYYEVYPLKHYELLCDAETGVETLIDNDETARYLTNEFDDMIEDIVKNSDKQLMLITKYPEYFI